MEVTLEQLKKEVNDKETVECTNIFLNNALYFIQTDEKFGELWVKVANKLLELPEYQEAMEYLFEKSKKEEENGCD